MGSNSRRRSNSSARSASRRKVVLSAKDTSHVRNTQPKRKVNSTRAQTAVGTRQRSDAARKLAANKRAERERRLQSQRRTFKLRATLTLLIVVAIAAGAISLYRSQLFAITSIDVIDNSRLSVSEVIELAAMPDDATLLRFPAGEMVSRLESSPWIISAVVTRDFPDTARIRVTERVPIAQVDVGGASFWLVSGDGVMIAEQTPDTTSTLIVVRDVVGLDPQPGIKTGSEPLLNALNVWAGLSDELRAMVRAISASSIDKTALITHDDVEIFVGSAEDIEKKDVVARGILQEQQGNVVSVNVRTVDRPTWRGIGEE